MVGITRAVVTALLAAVTAAALPGRPAFSIRGRSVDNGNGEANETAQVDLGYAVHEATLQVSNYTYYNFSNIRFAEPPVGDLRFKAPVKATTVNRTINRGENAHICVQASPGWVQQKTFYAENLTIADLGTADPSESEDCLFLDVYVPTNIWKKEAKRQTRGKADSGAPVLVWIYGGGYTAGDKNYQPETLISRAEENGGEGVVFVAMNYRLGMFGFMAGPTFQENGTANAGFYDQRLALEWVQENIHLFGGDPDRVTVFGESAGGGSIMYQITAYGGLKGPVPFARAITQSPGVQPIVGNTQKEAIFQATLDAATKLTNTTVTTLQQLRELDTETIRNINAYVVALSVQGTWTYGPMVDGLFAPDTAQTLLLHGQFDQGVEIMTGHNADEGTLLTNSAVTTQEQFVSTVAALAPGGDASSLKYITEELYPPVYDGSHGYTTPFKRLSLLIAETGFTCYTRYLQKAKKGEGYSYLFSVPPALHGQDVAFTFYNPREPNQDYYGFELPINATIASTLQRYITNFALTGTPNGPATVPYFPAYGTNESITNLGVKGLPLIQLDTVSNQANKTNNAGDRCDWFQKGLWT